MVDAKQLVKLACIALGVFGIAMVAVSIFGLVASTDDLTGINTSEAGDSPKIAIAAGLLLIGIAVMSIFVKFENKMHIVIVGAALLLTLALTIAAMSVAIKDLKNINDAIKAFNILNPATGAMMKELSKKVRTKLTATAAVSGLTVGYEILVGLLLAFSITKAGSS